MNRQIKSYNVALIALVKMKTQEDILKKLVRCNPDEVNIAETNEVKLFCENFKAATTGFQVAFHMLELAKAYKAYRASNYEKDKTKKTKDFLSARLAAAVFFVAEAYGEVLDDKTKNLLDAKATPPDIIIQHAFSYLLSKKQSPLARGPK